MQSTLFWWRKCPWVFSGNIIVSWWVLCSFNVNPFEHVHLSDSSGSFLKLCWGSSGISTSFYWEAIQAVTLGLAPGILAQMLDAKSWESAPMSISAPYVTLSSNPLVQHPQGVFSCTLCWFLWNVLAKSISSHSRDCTFPRVLTFQRNIQSLS